jgi:hypothetical protein
VGADEVALPWAAVIWAVEGEAALPVEEKGKAAPPNSM